MESELVWAAGVGGGHVQCFGTYFLKVKVPVKFRSSSKNWIGTDWWLSTNPVERNGSKLFKN